jgi:hypothetical protein
MEKKIIDKEELFAQIKNLTTWGFGLGALITSANVFINAHAALEVAPISFPVPIIEHLEVPFGATERARKMKLDLAQLKKQIAAAKVKEKPDKGCACLMPSEKAQVFVADAEKFMEDAHDSMRSGNFQAVVSAWDNVRRDIRLAQEALQECK